MELVDVILPEIFISGRVGRFCCALSIGLDIFCERGVCRLWFILFLGLFGCFRGRLSIRFRSFPRTIWAIWGIYQRLSLFWIPRCRLGSMLLLEISLWRRNLWCSTCRRGSICWDRLVIDFSCLYFSFCSCSVGVLIFV